MIDKKPNRFVAEEGDTRPVGLIVETIVNTVRPEKPVGRKRGGKKRGARFNLKKGE